MRPTVWANLILVPHTLWLVGMILSPAFLSWWQILAAGAGVALLDLPFGGCPVTKLEYRLRRADGYHGRARSLMGRLLDLVGLHLTEGQIVRLEIVLMGMLVAQAEFREVVHP